MRSPAVVVLGIGPERAVEMPPTEDEGPVEALGQDRLDHQFRVRVSVRCLDRISRSWRDKRSSGRLAEGWRAAGWLVGFRQWIPDHRPMAAVRVLDPACGSGNFLYIALRKMKDLEREAIGWASDRFKIPLELFVQVGPQNVLGLELKTSRRGDHAVERRIAPSARIEDAIEAVLLDGISGPDELSQLGRLGAQLILQRAVDAAVSITMRMFVATSLDGAPRPSPAREVGPSAD